MSARRVLLLLGSPHEKDSASEALGSYLIGRLADDGLHRKTISLQKVGSSEAATKLLAACDRADLIVLSTPMYVDSLPAPVIAALETIAAHRLARGKAAALARTAEGYAGVDRRRGDRPDSQRFAAVIALGFPEASQADTAIAICRRFAQETGLEWAGALALGASGMVSGKNLAAETGGRLRNVVKALDESATALAAGHDIPASAVALMAKPVVRARLYRLATNTGWRRMARKRGTSGRLDDRPVAL